MGDVSLTNESVQSDIEREEETTTDATEVTRIETNSKPDEAQYEEPGSIYLNNLRPAADRLFGDNLSLYAGNVSNGQNYGQLPPQTGPSSSSAPEAKQTSRWKRSMVYRVWAQGKGMLMVVLSQFFGSSMNVMTQLLERDGSHGKAMHPFQILFSRMIITVAASFFYMWYAQVPDPFGSRGIRGLLMLRAAGGFFGVFGMYFSLLYMPLSEATVLTFLSPIVACYACSFLMPNEPFTRKQQLAGVISLLGVVLIARPFSGGKDESLAAEIPSLTGEETSTLTEIVGGELSDNDMADGVSAIHHLMAVGFGILGVFGAACAYVTIRLIGPRAHPLVSVTYFSAYTTTVSLIAMIAIPSVSFRLPGNLMEWGLLLGLGATGFTMQYLLTAGLAYQPPSIGGKQPQKGNGTRATSMLYTQMLFALFYDKVVMDSSPSAISWAGSGLILGSALYVGVIRDNGSNNNNATRSVSQDSAQSQGQGGEDEPQAGRVKDRISSRDIRDAEEGLGLLTESDDIDAEAEGSSSSS